MKKMMIFASAMMFSTLGLANAASSFEGGAWPESANVPAGTAPGGHVTNVPKAQTPTAPYFIGELRRVRIESVTLSNGSAIVRVGHGGGCGTHEFHLIKNSALCKEVAQEPKRYSCEFEVVDRTQDNCEAYIIDTLEIPLAKFQLDDKDVSGRELIFVGDDSKVSVTLP